MRTASLKFSPLLLGLASGGILVGFSFYQRPTNEAITVSRTYTDREVGTIASKGACSITPDTIACWNVNGEPDSDLAEKVKAYYIVQPNTNLNFVFGRKNRILAFERPGYSGNGVNIGPVTTPEGGYINTGGQIGGNNGRNEPYLEWYPVATDLDAKTASIVFTLSKTSPAGNIDLKEGAVGDFGVFKLHIDHIKPGETRASWNGFNQNQRIWMVDISVTGPDAVPFPTFSGRAFDKRGLVITRVDESGNPVTEKVSRNPGYPGMYNQRGFDATIYNSRNQSSSQQQLSLPVNPSRVDKLQLTAVSTKNVTITDIPLDPK